MTTPLDQTRAEFEAHRKERTGKRPHLWDSVFSPRGDVPERVKGTYIGGDDQAAWEAWQAAIASRWQPIETAPRDGTPILGYCVHSDDAYYEEAGNRLTDYGARAEGLSHVEDGAHVLVWDDAYECSDGWEMPSCTIPAWWTLAHDAEVTANPTHWQPITPPTAAKAAKETPDA